MDEKYVFISYKVEEYDAAKAVKDHLEANGIPCWMAPMSIRGGMSYAQEIPPAIQGSSVFLLMLSEAAQASKWVPREVDQAINCGKLVMPYMLENCPLRSDFSFYLTNVQRYEAFRDPEETLARMTRDIQEALGITPPEKKPEAVAVAVEEPPVAETPVVTQAPAPKTVKKEKVKKPAGKKKKLLPLFLGGGLLLAALLVALVLLQPRGNTIGGQQFKKDAFSVNLEGVTLTQAEIDRFAAFEGLCVIRLENCSLEAENLQPLAIGGLLTLEMIDCDLSDAQFATIDFSGIRRLGTLNISGNPDLTGVGELSACAESLTELNISDTGIKSFAWLKPFTKLEILKADRTGLQDTTLLEPMIYLETLSLSGNGITSLEGLKNTSKLSVVDLSHNSLTDVSVLSRSEACLTALQLENNQLTDLNCLSKTETLKKVYVDHNRLTDLRWLKNNKELQILSASHNQINAIFQLGIGEKLRYLNLSNNALAGIYEGDLVCGDDNYLVVDLCDNKLITVQLPKNCAYKTLALLGNPKMKLSELSGLTGWNVYFDFPENADPETMKALDFYSLCIVGCPLDRQVEMEEGLTTENLMTREEAETEIKKAADAEAY